MRKEGPICLASLFSLKLSLRESPRFQSWVADSDIMKRGGFPAEFAVNPPTEGVKVGGNFSQRNFLKGGVVVVSRKNGWHAFFFLG